MKHSTQLLHAALAVAALSLSSHPTQAWESDVHYGLTEWLAIQAGFDRNEAKEIARQDQKVDDSWITGPMTSTLVSSCIGFRDDKGSLDVHDNHFPSEINPRAN